MSKAAYEIDLQTRRHSEVDALYQAIIDLVNEKVKTNTVAQFNEGIDGWCLELADKLGLFFYRNDNWLCFCDPESAPESVLSKN